MQQEAVSEGSEIQKLAIANLQHSSEQEDEEKAFQLNYSTDELTKFQPNVSKNANERKRWMPADQRAQNKIWMPVNQNENELRNSKIQGAQKRKFLSQNKKRKLKEYDVNPRLAKKRRLLASIEKNTKNHKIPMQGRQRRVTRKRNLGMKQKLVSLNNKMFNKLLNEATREQIGLAENIRKTLKIPNIVAKKNDHKQMKKFTDLFMYQNFDSATWTETVQHSRNKEGIKIVYMNANGKVWQKINKVTCSEQNS